MLRIVECDPQEVGVDLDSLADFVDAMGPLAVVDLETTGLSDQTGAEILEIGAVLLDPGSRRLTTVDGLVRPSAPIPLPIQRITGITDADVEGAPRIGELAATLHKQLAGRVLIAHNAEFERRFLTRYIDPALEHGPYLDTQDLLALTHPDAPDLRLESFTRMLLASEERHRALEDALDTTRVLVKVASGARQREPRYIAARRALDRYAPESPWLRLLGRDFGAEPVAAPDPYVKIGDSKETPVPFDEEAIAAVLADETRGRRYLPGYRAREEQIELARQFVRNFYDGGVLLLEGGTGVGKSLAYLAAAIPFAMERAAGGIHEPILISTRTRLLQDQLLEKDIANAARMLGYPELRAVSIKGRANYVCARRLDAVLAEGREPSIFAEDRLAYAVMMACAKTRAHGEVGTLPAALLRRYPPLRELRRRSVAQRAEQCSREDCARRPDCPFGRRRSALARAQIVVANHDLLLRWPPDYPAFTHAVLDEGHEIAGVADEVYAISVSPEEIFERVDELFGRSGERRRGTRGIVPHEARRRSQRDVRAWRRGLQLDLGAIGRALSHAASEYGEVQLPTAAALQYPEAAELAENAALTLEQLAAEAEQSVQALEDQTLAASVERIAAELGGAADGLRAAFGDESGDSVAAFERLEPPYDRWRLVIRRVSPAAAFHAEFLSKLESFAAVSASLFVAGDPFAALGELEVEDRALLPVGSVRVGSPFPYADHMRVVALTEEGDLVQDTARVIADLARMLGGRTLGLFTSLRRMNHVAELLSEELSPEGFEILAPRRAADDPGALVQRFCSSPGGAVLLGARTFWQGLDIPGEDLQAVVIEKLPFEVPTELRRRREARIRAAGGNPFTQFALGKMLLYLKQMAGRLIRSEHDRGIVVVVEGRTDRRYFSRLTDAFPEGTSIRVATRSDLPGILAEIGLGREPEGPIDGL